MRVRGRWFVIGWTVVFLGVAGLIVARERGGFEARRALDALATRASALEAIRVDLQGQIATLKSREVLAPKVEARGLRFPSDSEMVVLDFARHN
jgi:hypothetical protein